LSFKHQTNKPTAISTQHNQWKEKHKTLELQITFNAGLDVSLLTDSNKVKYKNEI
jgi:hypothetical protein